MASQEGWAPPARGILSQWSEGNRVLFTEASAEPGRFELRKTPYLRRMMDCYTDPKVQRVVAKIASQLGKTESLVLSPIAYHIAEDPCSILLVCPSEDFLNTYSSTRIGPMLKGTPALRGKIVLGKNRGEESTKDYKKFLGGFLKMVSKGSVAGLRAWPVRVLICEECDAPGGNREGNWVKLAEARTRNFWNRKIVLISSPGDESTSIICPEFDNSSRENWFVPCPACTYPQILIWDGIKFRTATYECQECRNDFEQHRWLEASERGGHWIACEPENPVKGFELNNLVSPWVDWRDSIKDFLEATRKAKEGDYEDLKVFKNTVLCELWRTQRETLDWEALYNRREEYPDADAPNEVLLVTLTIDVQARGWFYEFQGWGLGKERWALETGVIDGDPRVKDDWREIDPLLERSFTRADGSKLELVKALIDSGGSATSQVYRYVKQHYPKIVATRGMGGQGIPIIHSRTYTKDIFAVLYNLGVDTIKDEVMGRLKVPEPGPGFWHYPKGADGEPVNGYDQEFFQQLCSEHAVEFWRAGVRSIRWEPIRHSQRNEGFDLSVYSIAALEIAGGKRALEEAYEVRKGETKRARQNSSWGLQQGASSPQAPIDQSGRSRFGSL